MKTQLHLQLAPVRRLLAVAALVATATVTTGCGATVPTPSSAPVVVTAPVLAPVPTRPAPVSRSARRVHLARPAPTAMLTGSDLAAAIGGFSYRPNPDGSVNVDPAWVAANIRTETVPIIGQVTCHRLAFPQLSGAMQEMVQRGWSGLVRPSDFGGCWVPRYIRHEPTDGLSLHTWGIAFDINVSTNQRGTIGDLDPRLVEVMARWGFAWGGTWDDPDPMHFQLGALLRSAPADAPS